MTQNQMEELLLPKPVNGAKLIEILRTTVEACNTRSFSGIYKLQEVPMGNLSDYVIDCSNPLKRGPCDDRPNFMVRFEGIRTDGQYSSVPYRTQVWGPFTRGIQDIDLNANECGDTMEYRNITSRLVKKVIELSDQ